jgi:hypothetical protein
MDMTILGQNTRSVILSRRKSLRASAGTVGETGCLQLAAILFHMSAASVVSYLGVWRVAPRTDTLITPSL